MRDGPVPAKAMPRWLLTIIRKLRFDSPLAKRIAPRSRPPMPPAPMSREELAKLTPTESIARIEAFEADEAWAAYQLLTPQMQKMVAAHCNLERWSELLTRELRDQAVECLKREKAAPPVTPSSGPIDYFKFKSTAVRCPLCAWSGLGDQCPSRAIPGDSDKKTLLRTCPVCSSTVALTAWPTVAELLEAWATLSAHEREVVFAWEQEQEGRESAPHS
jgi:hypothetical protein